MKPPIRLFGGIGFAASILFIINGCSSPKSDTAPKAPAQAAKSPSRKSSKTHTYLYVDWTDVEKGRVIPVYDTNLLTDEAKTDFIERKKAYNVDTKFGPHGTEQYHIAHNIHIEVEKGAKLPRFIVADKPWEEEIVGGNVILEDGKFRCWYQVTFPKQKVGIVYAEAGRGMETNGMATCYAESTDGLHWTKPSLGIHLFEGSKENNIVSPISVEIPFLDKHGLPEERYKAFTFDELPADEVPKNAGILAKYGLYGMVSPDGYHWSRLPKPLVRHFCDTWNCAGWDPLLGKYVGYFRGHAGGRSITRAETDDFHHWPMPETVMCTGPEETAMCDYYSSGYTTYPGLPSLRLMFPGIYHLDTSLIDVRLALSRDGFGWNWVSSTPVIEVGKSNEWDSGMVFGQPDMFRLGDGRLAVCYSGWGTGHETDFSTVYKNWPKPGTGLAWAVWPDSRLAGIVVDKEGDFYSADILRNIASIEINARTERRGRIEFELVEKDKVLPGYSFKDCVPFTGDELWTKVRFKGKSDFAELRDKKIQLHFRLTHAKIFASRVVNN